jgi:hypothetical protein
MRIREAQIHTDPTDPDPDSEHWSIYIILQRYKKSYRRYGTVEIKVFLTFFGLMMPGLRIRIRIGSGFNRVSGSGSGFGIRIRIRIQEGKNDSKK